MKLHSLLLSLLICTYQLHSMEPAAAVAAATAVTDSQQPVIHGSQDDNDEELPVIPVIPGMQFPKVYFSPGIQDVLLQFIDKEQSSIRGALYRFTLYKPAAAKAEGIEKRKITRSEE